MTEEALPVGRRVAWEAVTTGVLTGLGVLVADVLDAPGWALLLVIIVCVVCGPPAGRRLAPRADR